MHTNNVRSSPLFSCFPDCFVFHCAFITTCQLIIHSFPFMQWMKDKCVWSHCILLHCIRDIDLHVHPNLLCSSKLNIPWYLGWIGKLTDVIQFGRIGPHTLILSLIEDVHNKRIWRVTLWQQKKPNVKTQQNTLHHSFIFHTILGKDRVPLSADNGTKRTK